MTPAHPGPLPSPLPIKGTGRAAPHPSILPTRGSGRAAPSLSLLPIRGSDGAVPHPSPLTPPPQRLWQRLQKLPRVWEKTVVIHAGQTQDVAGSQEAIGGRLILKS